MSFSIPITGLAANDPVPGTYVEVNFAQGEAVSGAGEYAILLVGNKTTAGSATTNTLYGPDTPTAAASQTDVDTLFGARSNIARMFKRVASVSSELTVYMIAAPESAGNAATGTITISTTATGSGVLRCWICDEYVDVSIASGDTATVIGDALEDAINGKLDWPVTASNTTGTVTITAALKGPEQNWLRYNAQIISSSSIATTVTPTSVTYMSGGTTADSQTNALAAILPDRFYYIVQHASGASGTNTLLTNLVTQVNTQALPVTGIRQRVFAGSVDTLANTTTMATGLNAARCEIAWLEQCDVPPSELAAYYAAICALEESSTVPRCNFSGYGSDFAQDRWNIKAPRSLNKPTRTQVKSALNNGITALGVTRQGGTYITKRVTTRSLSGSTPDYRIRDAHKVTVADRFADDLKAKVALQLAGKNIGDDPAQGQRAPGNNVVTPRNLRGIINRLVDEYEGKDLVQNADDIRSGVIVNRESSPTTRMTARIPLQTVDIADQFGLLVDQTA